MGQAKLSEALSGKPWGNKPNQEATQGIDTLHAAIEDLFSNDIAQQNPLKTALSQL